MADDDGDAFDATRQFGQRAGAGAVEIRPQQQVLRRVAGQRQFRRHHQVGAGGACAIGEFGDAARVAGQIADRAVDLGEGYAE